MIKTLQPTSKVALKQQAMIACQGDVKKAKELYDFFVDGLESLPDFDPVKPSVFEQVKEGIGGFFSWAKDNRETIEQGYEIIRGIAASRGKNLPNIGTESATPLPNINE